MTSLIRGSVRSWVEFWFTPADPLGLHCLRVLAGICLLTWLLPFAGHVESLFGLLGWFDFKAYQQAAAMPEGPPPISWSLLYLCGSNATLLESAYWLSLGIIGLFTLGIAPRLTSILTWAIVVSFTANPAMIDDAEALMPVFAFYLMIGYVLKGPWNGGIPRLLLGETAWPISLVSRPRLDATVGSSGERAVEPLAAHGQVEAGNESFGSVAANIAVRLLQIHFAIAILISGLHKLQYADWWAGAALWYPLHPPYRATLEQMRAHAAHAISYLTMLSLATYAALGWQISFPLFAWRPRLRMLLLAGAAIGWLGTAYIYELPMFGPVLVLGCLSYLTIAEWQRVTGWFARLVGAFLRPLRARTRREPAGAKVAAKRSSSESLVSGRRR